MWSRKMKYAVFFVGFFGGGRQFVEKRVKLKEKQEMTDNYNALKIIILGSRHRKWLHVGG